MADFLHRIFDRGRGGYAKGMLIFFSAMLLLGAVMILVCLLLAAYGWHPQTMQILGAGVCTVEFALAAALLICLVTERKAVDQKLSNSEARIFSLIDSAMDAIITVDAQQRILQFNAAAESVFLWPRAAVIGQPLYRLIPARFHGSHREHVERFGKTGMTSRRMGDRTAVTGVRADGEEFPMEASISQIGDGDEKLFTVILRDITERLGAEEQLARNEARLRSILESAMDAIVTVDDSQHIVLFNAAAETVFGCPRKEAIGAPLAWFIPERYRAVHGEHLSSFGATGATSRRMGGTQPIVTGLRRNGEEFPLEASISQITEGGSKFYTVILRDVTERVRAESVLRLTQEELREFSAVAHSIREQEKSRIARELHDELGQALTALRMDVNWVIERLSSEQEVLTGKMGKMLALVDATVAATRRISSDLRPLLLDDLGLVPAVEWLVDNFRQHNDIGCELNIDAAALDFGEPYTTAIFRILQESLTNISRHAQASLVEISIKRAGDEVNLYIRDNGRGFDANARKPDSHGLMGLRERVYMLNGDVRIDSERGRGTVIEVSIPLVAAEGRT